ncbi:MAG: hypothetical protein EWV92_16500 [Microcystis aeruginosa Ma_MB_S_20031200_S102]|uniref:histidine kinase n=1 Tax=Microcystis aeruginosa Ma_MB_S_20031200_S102 TaxID=2486254 RepID=A0A552EHF4_MICAE|nr:MAG: hypothetical protein EWV79_13290 [Microcystis aeruginosa Ma_MB_S_20031200_S102D]TRU33877.1 MAG: hypothetical protein EWV92_16500 [Microcystis aeruginosa Ma_MB_S_20031200_S102]
MRTAQDVIKQISGLSQKLTKVPPEQFIRDLPDELCTILEADACVLWQKDEDNFFTVLAKSKQVSEDYKLLKLDGNLEQIQKGYQKQGWVSMLSAPLVVGGEMIGILQIFTSSEHHFSDIEKEAFKLYANLCANLVALSFEKALYQDKETLKKLTNIMIAMLSAKEIHEIINSLLNGALDLVSLGINSPKKESLVGEISMLDYFTGELEIIRQSKNIEQHPHLKLGEGLTGRALKEKRVVRVNNLSDSKDYKQYWQEAHSEIAVPIFVENIPVRREDKVTLGSKLIGVLNIESRELEAFSEIDEKYLGLLARYAAILIDKQQFDHKLSDLREREREITNLVRHNEIMEKVMDSVFDVLDFHMVNISLVNFEAKRIKTEFVKIRGEDDLLVIEQFKKAADHLLESTDIQAWVVNEKKIVVPQDVNDSRFNTTIRDKFGHKRLIRVFMPMIDPFSSRVIGTLEAGYLKTYREDIYERDVQILENFVDHVVYTLERKRSGFLDKIAHEIRSPLVGIRSNASFLQKRWSELPDDLIDRKLEDILTDSAILLYQFADLEYILKGHITRKAKIERTFIFRDVIIKTINQLRPLIVEAGFSTDNIKYEQIDPSLFKVQIQTDKPKINQVVYNLLINAIKYAKVDPNQFKIIVDIDNKNRDAYILKFKDWGIGIKDADKENIFREGFRSSEAITKNVLGSGLGLAISKSIMRNLGGDLILANLAEPTEFHLIIPKKFSFPIKAKA